MMSMGRSGHNERVVWHRSKAHVGHRRGESHQRRSSMRAMCRGTTSLSLATSKCGGPQCGHEVQEAAGVPQCGGADGSGRDTTRVWSGASVAPAWPHVARIRARFQSRVNPGSTTSGSVASDTKPLRRCRPNMVSPRQLRKLFLCAPPPQALRTCGRHCCRSLGALSRRDPDSGLGASGAVVNMSVCSHYCGRCVCQIPAVVFSFERGATAEKQHHRKRKARSSLAPIAFQAAAQAPENPTRHDTGMGPGMPQGARRCGRGGAVRMHGRLRMRCCCCSTQGGGR